MFQVSYFDSIGYEILKTLYQRTWFGTSPTSTGSAGVIICIIILVSK